MPTLRSSDTGHLADFIMNTYAKWCTSMLLPLPKVSTTELSAGAGENPWWNETWSWNPPPWSSSALTPPGRTLQTFTRMFISFGDCLGGVAVKRVLKNAFTRTFWTPSKNASSVSGHLHHWRQNRDRAEPGHLAQAPMLGSLPQTMPITRGSWLQRGTHVRKCWQWQETPINGHWWPQHYWKIRLRGWSIPSAAGTQVATGTQAAADAWPDTDEGDPRPQDINPKSPRQCHVMATLLKGEPSHPALPNQGGRWPLPRGGPPCHPKIALGGTPG